MIAAARASAPAPETSRPAAAPASAPAQEPPVRRFGKKSKQREAPHVADPVVQAKPAEVEVEVEAPTRISMPPVYEFAPIKGARRILTLALLVSLAGTAYLGYNAYYVREAIWMQLAGVSALVTLIIWAARAGGSVTKLTLRAGQLEIVRQGSRLVFDLQSQYTPIEVHGRGRGWKVEFIRRGIAPAVVDASMVDPKDFMRVLTFYRPDLDPDAQPSQQPTRR